MSSQTEPKLVRILYEPGKYSHIFTSPDLPGLMIGDSDPRKAFMQILPGIHALVEARYNVSAIYELNVTLEEFLSSQESERLLTLENLFIEAREESSIAAH